MASLRMLGWSSKSLGALRPLARLNGLGRAAACSFSTSTFAGNQRATPVAETLKDESGSNALLGALGRTTSGKRLNIRTYPQFERLEDERLYRKQHLAGAFRVFAERGFDEGVAGHISASGTNVLAIADANYRRRTRSDTH
jgi:hypothetical protein